VLFVGYLIQCYFINKGRLDFIEKARKLRGNNIISTLLSRQLYLILSMLVHKDEGVKLEAGINKEKEKEKENEKEKDNDKDKDKDKDKETNSLIVSIFQSIKCSEDVVDREKSKVGEKCL